MRFRRYTKPNDTFLLAPWYVPQDQTWWEIGSELFERLDKAPEDTFVVMAIEDNVGKAFLAAYVEKDYVWVWQARAAPNFKHQWIMYEGLKYWAKSKAKDKLKMGCDKRLQKFFERRYGFRPIGGDRMEGRL